MCVYSQEAEVTRDARVGEPLKVRKFTHATGFCPVGEAVIAACVRPGSVLEFVQPIRYTRPLFAGLFWHTIKTEHTTAKLVHVGEYDPRLKSISDKDLARYCHDWLELPNGALICLGRLVPGQIARVHDPVKKLLDDANAAAKASSSMTTVLPPRELAHEGNNGVEPCGFHREGWHQPNREGWLAPTRT